MPVPESLGRGPAADDPMAPIRVNCQDCRRCLFAAYSADQLPDGGAEAVFTAYGCPTDCGGLSSTTPDPDVLAEYEATAPDRDLDDPDVGQDSRRAAATVSYTGRPNVSAASLMASVTADPRFQAALEAGDSGVFAATTQVPPPPGQEFPIPPPIAPGSSEPTEMRASLRRTNPTMAGLVDATAIRSPVAAPGFVPDFAGDGWAVVHDPDREQRIAALTTAPSGPGVATVSADEVSDEDLGHGPADEPEPADPGPAEVVELAAAPRAVPEGEPRQAVDAESQEQTPKRKRAPRKRSASTTRADG